MPDKRLRRCGIHPAWHTHIDALLWLRTPAADEEAMRGHADRIQAELYGR
jgi:hypothetical protein